MLRQVSWKTGRDLLLTLGFVVIVAVPGSLAAARGFPPEPLYENRPPAPYPEPRATPAAKFPSAFERWFADRFAFRGALVRLSSRLRYALSVSSAPLALVGKNGWLLFKGDLTIQGFRRTKTFDHLELQGWRSSMNKRRDWLAARGIRYLAVIHPNKESIYPEFVPSKLNRLPGASAKEQLVETLESAGIHVVDSTEAVLGIKATGREVFLHTDTHWNGLGCFAGYRAVAEHLATWFPSIRPMGLDAFRVSHNQGPGGDLSSMLALPDMIVEMDRSDVQVASPRTRRTPFEMPLPPDIGPHEMPYVLEQPDSSLPRAVVMGDSFMAGVTLFLGEHFSRLVYYGRHEMAPELIEREHPDVVIDAWVERMLFRGPPSNAGFDPGKPAEDVLIPHPGTDQPHEPGLPFANPASWTFDELERGEEGTVVATGSTPSVTTHVSPFGTAQTQTIWVELTAFPLEAGTIKRRQVHLFWGGEGEIFDETRTAKFSVLTDGKAHRYRIEPALSPGWTGEVANLRLHLPTELEGAVYRLGAIELVP